mgnify:CR=1 FL=1
MVGVAIEPPRPNPTGGTSTVRFRLDEAQTVTVALYDAVGRRVRTLLDETVAGETWQTLTVDGSDLPVGTYVVRVSGPRATGVVRLSVVR